MILTYLVDPLSGSRERVQVKARITRNHSTSSYGQPVVVLEDGNAISYSDWIFSDYRVKSASNREWLALDRFTLCVPASFS